MSTSTTALSQLANLGTQCSSHRKVWKGQQIPVVMVNQSMALTDTCSSSCDVRQSGALDLQTDDLGTKISILVPRFDSADSVSGCEPVLL